MLDSLAESLGASPSQIALVFLIIISVPLSLVFPYLPSSNNSLLPHLYAALPSLVYLWTILGLRNGFFELVASTVATWCIASWGVKTKMGKQMPWIVFVVVMGHLAANHIHRHLQGHDVVDIEITGSQMVLVMKLTSFAWSVYDGQRPDAELDATQRASKIEKMPGLIPFLGYAFFFPSILAGPAYTWSSYEAFTSHNLFLKEAKSIPSSNISRPLIPEGRRRKASKRFVTGLIYLGIYSVYSWQYGYGRMLEKGFESRPLWSRILFMNLAGFVARTKYYSVWCIAESAFIASGFGFNPATGHYDASRNVRIRSIELAPNFKILLDSWNMNTNVWLRECIYKRVAKKGRKPGFKSTQITFITSALWHGVNPCYLMTFILGGFCQALGRSLRSLVRPFFLPPGSVPLPKSATAPSLPKPDAPSADAKPSTSVASKPTVADAPKKVVAPPQTPLKWCYDIIGIVATQLALNFAVAPFMLLSVQGSLAAWRSVDYYGLLMVGLPFLAFKLGLAGHLKRALKKRDEGAVRKANSEEERKRLAWEREEQRKRVARGEGIPSLGMDVEKMLEEEEREEKARLARSESKKEL